MGMIDELADLRRTRARLAELRWSCSKTEPRLFDERGSRTTEIDTPHSLIADAIGVVEHEFSADISYCGSYVVGDAIKSCVLRFLDKKILKLAKNAQAEIDAAKQIIAGATP